LVAGLRGGCRYEGRLSVYRHAVFDLILVLLASDVGLLVSVLKGSVEI
jgi:hypothetical protein